jgi:hypothetical protein
MKALINRLITDATAPIEEMSPRRFGKAALFFVAMSYLFVSSIFLTIALFIFVQSLVGTAITALATGSICVDHRNERPELGPLRLLAAHITGAQNSGTPWKSSPGSIRKTWHTNRQTAA